MNAIGTQLGDLMNSVLTRSRLIVYVDAVAESGRNPAQKGQMKSSLSAEKARRPNLSRDHTLRHERGQGILFPVQLTTRAGLATKPG